MNSFAMLFYLIKCVKNNETPILEKDAPIDNVIKIADKRGVLCYIYKSLEKAGYVLPQEYAAKMAREKEKQCVQIYYKNKIKEAFKANKIHFAFIKGDDIAKYLPIGAERFSCDVDMFYSIKHKKAVRKIMKDLGFTCVNGGFGTDDFQIDPKISFEGHYSLECGFRYNPYDDFSHFEINGDVFNMTPQDVYIYHIIHFANHFKTAGGGLRSLIDTYFLRDQINAESKYVKQTLDKIGLTEFNETIKKALSACFEGGEHDEYITWFVKYLLSSGIYGSSVNRTKVIAYSTENASKKRIFFKRAFPSYKEMKIAYPCIGKFPPFILFFWFYRLLKVAVFGSRKVKQEMKEIKSIDNSVLVKEREYYHRLGF